LARILKIPWHTAFRDCVMPHTDAPVNFIEWSAISLIGAALKNNVHFEIGTFTLYPNQFIVLVAPPGIGKGTSMDLIEKLVADDKIGKVVNCLNDRITAERIIERIADGWAGPMQIRNQQLVIGSIDHSCLLFSTELRVLLGASDWMLEYLEEAWSKTTYDYQTKNKGSVFIDNMCCSLLAASVPDFLRNVNREAHMVITGGFSSRCLFIYAENTSKDLPFPEPLKKNKRSFGIWTDLVSDLRAISSLKGEFTVSPAARVLFEDFLKKNRAEASTDDSEAIANFRARVKAHVLKLGMIFSASRGDTLCIDQIDMANSITEVSKVVKNLEKLFRGAGDSLDAVNTARVQQFIEKRGTATKKEILRGLHRHFSSETLDRILYVLQNIGYCDVTSINKTDHYKVIIQQNQNGKVKP
jgi:Protein of unknown function (DUF3987)